MKARRVGKKIIKLTTFSAVKRGNWYLRYSCTDMGSIMLYARSVLAPENMFIKFFNDEVEATSFAEFLVHQDFYHPEIDETDEE